MPQSDKIAEMHLIPAESGSSVVGRNSEWCGRVRAGQVLPENVVKYVWTSVGQDKLFEKV
jgi:hypothetical protein